MSSLRECIFFEAEDRKWYYFLAYNEGGEYPNGEYYGRFSSKEEAVNHLDENHSNPGSSSEYNEIQPVPTLGAHPDGDPDAGDPDEEDEDDE